MYINSLSSDTVVRNNTFFKVDYYCIWENSQLYERNNIYYGPSSIGISASTVSNAYSLYTNISDPHNWNANEGTGDLITSSNSPSFISTNFSDYNTTYLRLNADSDAINAGDPADTDSWIIDGRIDMGAFEYGAAAFISLNLEKTSTVISYFSSYNPIPGATVLYTISYDNDDSSSGRGLQIIDHIPDCMTYVSNSATTYLSETNSLHTGATNGYSSVAAAVSIQVSADGTTWYNEGDLSAPAASLIQYIQWIFPSDEINAILANDSDSGLDTSGTIDGDIPDIDAGKLKYRTTIN